jgi:hypothetical protein
MVLVGAVPVMLFFVAYSFVKAKKEICGFTLPAWPDFLQGEREEVHDGTVDLDFIGHDQKPVAYPKRCYL